MVTAPVVTPRTTPELFTEATVGALLLQVPLLALMDKVVVLPVQTKPAPVTAGRPVDMVTTFVAGVPQVLLYVMVSVPTASA